MRVPNRTHPRRGTRRGAFHRQQCTAYAPYTSGHMLMAHGHTQLDSRVAGQPDRCIAVHLFHGMAMRAYKQRSVAQRHNRYSACQSKHAVVHGNAERHWSQLVRVSCRMARLKRTFAY